MTINSKLKYIRLNDNKRPIDKWKEEKNQYFSCDDLRNAALVITKDVVVIDFDGDNIDSSGEVKDSCIYRYILEKYRPYWVKSKSNHIHLYFKKPIELNIENWVDYITLGGFQVDYRTDGGYAVIKTQNKMRDSSQTLTKDVIDNLPDSLSAERKNVVKKACSLVGKLTYFWGGKSSAIGWDSEWGKMKLVTA